LSSNGPSLRLAEAKTLLCDVDGSLVDSEIHAFAASAGVMNRFLAEVGISRRFAADELRLASTGKNFRATAGELAEGRASADLLERWVLEEQQVVAGHLAVTLRPDPAVQGAVARLACRHELAAVSSSALERVDVCLEASGLASFFPPLVRFSAEDSITPPRSKPDPAIYRLAADRLRLTSGQAVAIEDAVPGVESALAAGIPAIGLVQFAPEAERDTRRRELLRAGAGVVAESWDGIAEILHPHHPPGVSEPLASGPPDRRLG